MVAPTGVNEEIPAGTGEAWAGGASAEPGRAKREQRSRRAPMARGPEGAIWGASRVARQAGARGSGRPRPSRRSWPGQRNRQRAEPAEAGTWQSAELAGGGAAGRTGTREEGRDVSPLAVVGIIFGVIALVGVAVGVLAVVTHGFRHEDSGHLPARRRVQAAAGRVHQFGGERPQRHRAVLRDPARRRVFATFTLPAGLARQLGRASRTRATAARAGSAAT